MEPPASLACATGTSPAATAAAEPPLDPPAVRPGRHGLWVGPKASGSLVIVVPSSLVFVLPATTNPALRKLRARLWSAGAR